MLHFTMVNDIGSDCLKMNIKEKERLITVFNCAHTVSLIVKRPESQVKLQFEMNLYTSCLLSRGNTIKTSGPINVVLSFSLMAGQISVVAARNLGVRHIS